MTLGRSAKGTFVLEMVWDIQIYAESEYICTGICEIGSQKHDEFIKNTREHFASRETRTVIHPEDDHFEGHGHYPPREILIEPKEFHVADSVSRVDLEMYDECGIESLLDTRLGMVESSAASLTFGQGYPMIRFDFGRFRGQLKKDLIREFEYLRRVLLGQEDAND